MYLFPDATCRLKQHRMQLQLHFVTIRRRWYRSPCPTISHFRLSLPRKRDRQRDGRSFGLGYEYGG